MSVSCTRDHCWNLWFVVVLITTVAVFQFVLNHPFIHFVYVPYFIRYLLIIIKFLLFIARPCGHLSRWLEYAQSRIAPQVVFGKSSDSSSSCPVQVAASSMFTHHTSQAVLIVAGSMPQRVSTSLAHFRVQLVRVPIIRLLNAEYSSALVFFMWFIELIGVRSSILLVNDASTCHASMLTTSPCVAADDDVHYNALNLWFLVMVQCTRIASCTFRSLLVAIEFQMAAVCASNSHPVYQSFLANQLACYVSYRRHRRLVFVSSLMCSSAATALSSS